MKKKEKHHKNLLNENIHGNVNKTCHKKLVIKFFKKRTKRPFFKTCMKF